MNNSGFAVWLMKLGLWEWMNISSLLFALGLFVLALIVGNMEASITEVIATLIGSLGLKVLVVAVISWLIWFLVRVVWPWITG